MGENEYPKRLEEKIKQEEYLGEGKETVSLIAIRSTKIDLGIEREGRKQSPAKKKRKRTGVTSLVTDAMFEDLRQVRELE